MNKEQPVNEFDDDLRPVYDFDNMIENLALSPLS